MMHFCRLCNKETEWEEIRKKKKRLIRCCSCGYVLNLDKLERRRKKPLTDSGFDNFQFQSIKRQMDKERQGVN